VSSAGTAGVLDHVGVAVRDLGRAAVAWEQLGFRLTAPAAQMTPGPDGTMLASGIANCRAMFRRGYVELIACVDPARPSATLGRFLERYQGIHVITLEVADAGLAASRLHLAGFAADLTQSARPADPDKPDSPQARFTRLPLAGAEPRLQLLQHHTPQLVWREAELHHPNRAVALEAVIIAADHPAELAARLSRAAGREVVPDPAGGFALNLVHGQVRVLPPEALGRVLPGTTIPCLPFVAGIVLRTEDENRAVSALPGPRARPVAGGLLAEATGVQVLFLP
jgi:hypothetical protein